MLSVACHCVCLYLRDYADEIHACVNIAAVDFKVTNLCIWTDLIAKKQVIDPNAGIPEQTLEDAEAEVEAAEFAAIRTKVAILAMHSA